MGIYLAIEASTEACSVALQYHQILNEDFVLRLKQHDQILLPAVQSLLSAHLLAPAQLDGIAFSAGPGSFTGLRLTAGITQGLAFAANCPVVAISSLRCFAYSLLLERNLPEGTFIWVAEDARMGDAYTAIYQVVNGQLKTVLDDRLEQLSQLVKYQCLLEKQNCYLLGSVWRGLEAQKASIDGLAELMVEKQFILRMDYYPRARAVIALAQKDFIEGNTLKPEQAVPVYLRESVSWQKWQKKSERKRDR